MKGSDLTTVTKARRFFFTWPRALIVIAIMTGAAAGLEVLAREYPDQTVQVIARTLQVAIVGALGVLSSGLVSRPRG